MLSTFFEQTLRRGNFTSYLVCQGDRSVALLITPQETLTSLWISTSKDMYQKQIPTLGTHNPNIKNMLGKNWNILEFSEELKKIFSTHTPIIGQRTSQNLETSSHPIRSDILPQAITSTQKESDLPPVCHYLGSCSYCPLLHKVNTFNSKHTGIVHK